MRPITSRSSMSDTIRISREHFGQSNGSASQTFLISSRHLADGMRRGVVLGYIDDLCRVVGGFDLFGGALVALAAHFVAVPAVVPDKLEALLGDVLGDLGDEVAGTEDLEVALNLRVETGAVDDRALGVGPGRGARLHFLDGEWIADDVLGQPLEVFALVGQHPPTAVHVEAGMHPTAEHLRPARHYVMSHRKPPRLSAKS